MTKRINKQISRMMGQNLKRMRQERGWTQKHLAELVSSDKRYISMMEKGRGIGKDLLDRLCVAFGVDEEAFTWQAPDERQVAAGKLPRVTQMILEELETMPEYEQLRLLAEIIERRIKKLEEQISEKQQEKSSWQNAVASRT